MSNNPEDHLPATSQDPQEEMDTNNIQENNNSESLTEITANMSKLNVNAFVFVPSSDAQQLELQLQAANLHYLHYQEFMPVGLDISLDLQGNPYVCYQDSVEIDENCYGEIAMAAPQFDGPPPPLPPPDRNTDYEMFAMETDVLYPSAFGGSNSSFDANLSASQDPPLLPAIYGPSVSTAYFYEPPKDNTMLYCYFPYAENLHFSGNYQTPIMPPTLLEDIPMPTAPKPASTLTQILSISDPSSTAVYQNWEPFGTNNTQTPEMIHEIKPNKIENQEDCEVSKRTNKKRRARNVDNCSKKEHVNLVFIGHVDAGKSTLGGQIMSLTGMINHRTLDKLEREAREKSRESWYLSWALDTNQEERDRGKTVEVGRAYFETEKKHFTILDAPGHKSFVPNMIGGAAQADFAVLVISARKGEFETGFDRGGQTREHAMLAKSSGVKHLIAVVNKMDDPTVNWDEKRYNECRDKILPYLKRLGFILGRDLSFLPVSGQTGQGILDQVPEDICKWYRGPSFIQLLDELPPISRKMDGPFIMPVADKFKDMGTVLMGKVEAGVIRVGSALLLMPNKVQVIVDQMWSDDLEVTTIAPGENVKIKVKGIEEEEISSGFVLCDITNPIPIVKVFDAQVVVLEHKSIICAGYSAVMHIHSAHEEVTVISLICLVDKKTGQKSTTRPRYIKQEQIAVMRLECAEIVCACLFKEFAQMGRFTLRDENKTIAIGKILKIIG